MSFFRAMGVTMKMLLQNFYAEYQERHGHHGIKVFPFGLVINPNYSSGLVPHQTGMYVIQQATLRLVVWKLNVLNLEGE